jgi:hypothetical protein
VEDVVLDSLKASVIRCLVKQLERSGGCGKQPCSHSTPLVVEVPLSCFSFVRFCSRYGLNAIYLFIN